MKILSLSRLAMVAAACSAAGLTAIHAQDSTDSAPPPPHEHFGHRGADLTPDERAELKKDMDQVLASNPDLKTEGETLHRQLDEHMKKVDAAIVAADPGAAPIIAKLEAAHHHGPPPGSGQ